MSEQTTPTGQDLHEKLMAIIHSPKFKAEEAERRARQATCPHAGWNFKQHGRCCWTCGIFMVDWGD